MMDCQRLATFCVKFEVGDKKDRSFCCKDHLVGILIDILAGRPSGTEAAVALHPVVNEEPCEHGVE